jgi:pimeloyl-ACP methyl ester carboxylesterase
MLFLLIVALLASVVFTGCGSQPAKRPPQLGVVSDGGDMVRIGGGRSLYLSCSGSGGPTVILEAGFGGTTNEWDAVQPKLARTTRTCAYDRAGLGNSLPIPGVHDAGDEIADLQHLLEHAKVAPPYVLVGHSYGGLLMRLFARAHPEETAGVVLVEAMGRDQDRRFERVWRALPAALRAKVPEPMGEPVTDGVDIRAGEALDSKSRSLPDVPLAVITRGRPDEELPRRVRPVAQAAWMHMQDELAAMSPDHVHVVATRSDHIVPSYATGQPGVVVKAVRAVTDAVRGNASLPACKRVFRGAGARCR